MLPAPDKTQGVSPGSPAAAPRRAGTAAPAAFQQALAAALERRQPVQLSGHANVRVAQRSLALDGPAMERLSRAVDRAHEKGVRSSLVLLDGIAAVVNVPERRVVTAMEAGEAEQRVFTNIDGVVFA